MILLSLLTGCSLLGGITNPTVMEGVALGVAPPTDSRIDLTDTEFEKGAAAALAMANASDLSNLADAPVDGADVDMLLPDLGSIPLHGNGDGNYSADSEDGLVYTEGVDATMSAVVDGVASSIRVRLPPNPVLDIPETSAPGRPLTVSLAGQAFDNMMVVVLDGETGDILFDNRPDTIQEIYDYTHGDSDLALSIPGDVFSEESVYLVGVAGLNNAKLDDIENANTALSAFLAGRLSFSLLSTLPPVQQ